MPKKGKFNWNGNMPAWANFQAENNNAELEEEIYQGECAQQVLPYAGAADILALAMWVAQERVQITVPYFGKVTLGRARQTCMQGIHCMVPKHIKEDVLFQVLNNPDAIAQKNMPDLLRAIKMELPRPLRPVFQRVVELAGTCAPAQRLVLRLFNGDVLGVLEELTNLYWHLSKNDPVMKKVDEIEREYNNSHAKSKNQVAEVPAKEVPAKEVPAKEVPTNEVPTKEVPTNEVPVKKEPLNVMLVNGTIVSSTPAKRNNQGSTGTRRRGIVTLANYKNSSKQAGPVFPGKGYRLGSAAKRESRSKRHVQIDPIARSASGNMAPVGTQFTRKFNAQSTAAALAAERAQWKKNLAAAKDPLNGAWWGGKRTTRKN